MISLFIGRFQPFHKGHLHALKDIVSNSKKVIVGVGSSQHKDTSENPFSYQERVEMIQKTLKAHNIDQCEFIAIPDINDDNKWVDHVCTLVGKFDVVYTGNKLTEDLFRKKSYPVKYVSFLAGINATIIRDLIDKEGDWSSLVPKEVEDYLVSINAKERIKTC